MSKVNKLSLWRQATEEFCNANNLKYTIFKKGTKNHSAVKSIYEKKLKDHNCCKVNCVNGCKSNCKCTK